MNWQTPSLAQTFTQLQRLCAEENYNLEVTLRQNRPNPFADDLDD